jgi:hypothetical protein
MILKGRRWPVRAFGLAWAWILWERAEFTSVTPDGTSSPPPAERMSSPYGTYESVDACEAAKVKLFQTTAKQYEPTEDSNQGVAKVQTVPYDMMVITFLGRGGQAAIQFRCASAEVDLGDHNKP